MNILKSILPATLLAISLSSCEKVIDIDLNSQNPQLVIEANFSNADSICTVQLSKTVNFSDSNTFPTVSNAVVILSDNLGHRDTLDEVNGAGLYGTNRIAGIPGLSYTLEVQAEGKIYIANNTMPQAVALDSVYTEESLFGGPDADRLSLVPVYTDPAGQGNNYKFVVYKNGNRKKGIFITDDAFTDGQANAQPLFGGEFKLNTGDIATVELQCIDAGTYLYYYSLLQVSSNGGPSGSAAPANPVSNFSGGCLGYFNAHTSSSYTITIP